MKFSRDIVQLMGVAFSGNFGMSLYRIIALGAILSVVWLFSGCSKGESPQCDRKSGCPNGLLCIDGRCQKKRCSVDEHCGFNEYCDKFTGTCKRKSRPSWRCRTDSDCRIGEICFNGVCRLDYPDGGETSEGTDSKREEVAEEAEKSREGTCSPPCGDGAVCIGGKCVQPDPKCKFDTDCKSPQKCNLLVDRCQQPCGGRGDCPREKVCRDSFCQLPKACKGDSDCGGDEFCAWGFCYPSYCSEDSQCPPAYACTGGKCARGGGCKADGDCRTGERCVNGRCAAPECSASKPCGGGKSCVDGKCVDTGQKCGIGKDCPSGLKCWRGKCVSPDYCEQDYDCTGTYRCISNRCGFCRSNSDCYQFQKCQNSKCVTAQKNFGEECLDTSQCVSNAVCLSDTGGKKLCRQKCDPIAANPGCPAGYGCALLSDKRSGACLPMGGGGGIGSPCSSQASGSCRIDLVCVKDSNGSFCMKLCDRRNPNCPNGGRCLSLGIDPVGVCEINGGGGGSGGKKGEDQPCQRQSECKSGLYCLGIGSSGYCTPGCDPYNPSCRAGKVCDLIVDYSGLKLSGAVCGPFIAGSAGEGQLCRYRGSASSCSSNLFCFPNLKNPGTGLCARPCDPRTKICPPGKQCIPSPIIYKGTNLWGCI